MAISKDKEAIQAIVNKEMADKIKKIAEEEKRSKANMAAILLEYGLKEYYNLKNN